MSPCFLAGTQAKTLSRCLGESLLINSFLMDAQIIFFFIGVNNVVNNTVISTSLHTRCSFP